MDWENAFSFSIWYESIFAGLEKKKQCFCWKYKYTDEIKLALALAKSKAIWICFLISSSARQAPPGPSHPLAGQEKAQADTHHCPSRLTSFLLQLLIWRPPFLKRRLVSYVPSFASVLSRPACACPPACSLRPVPPLACTSNPPPAHTSLPPPAASPPSPVNGRRVRTEVWQGKARGCGFSCACSNCFTFTIKFRIFLCVRWQFFGFFSTHYTLGEILERNLL